MSLKVFKIGGAVLEDASMMREFCKAFAAVEGPKVLVHGGGVLASSLQKRLGQTPQKIEGRRVTDADALQAVTMVYAGWCSKTLVATLQKEGCNALGLSGCDGNVICATKREPVLLSDGITVCDFGYVGDVRKESVNVALLHSLLSLGITPVLNAVNHDGRGQLLNTNADTVASSVAAALNAELICCFEFDGVLLDRNDPGSVIPVIGQAEFEKYCSEGVISEGMIPKLSNCLNALRSGASSAVVTSYKLNKAGTRIEL